MYHCDISCETFTLQCTSNLFSEECLCMYILKCSNEHKIWVLWLYTMKGLEALKEHFKASKFPSEAEEYMPVVFSPPRDGRTLSNPVPITGYATDKDPEEDMDDEEAAKLRQMKP